MKNLNTKPEYIIDLYSLRLTENNRELYVNIAGSIIYFLIDEKFEIRDDKEELFIRNSTMFVYIKKLNNQFILSNYTRC